jgi:pyruvate/2-oxoglutarate dehydrogenase complex dihydrolipoamide dehydrogenase (E3) component
MGSVNHCFNCVGGSFLPEHTQQKIALGQPAKVVVVGGGLTSAQITDVLIRFGVSKVLLLTRGKYKLKHFDVDLKWVSKLRNQQMSVFWSADSDQGGKPTLLFPTCSF